MYFLQKWNASLVAKPGKRDSVNGSYNMLFKMLYTLYIYSPKLIF